MEASPRRPVFTLLAFVCLLSALNCVAWEQEVNPPSFDVTPPQLVEFSNTLGTKLPCSASARPFPSNVSWLGEDGSPLKPITGLREILPDGTLVLLPFNAEHFRQDVHATSYKCALSNSFGTIVSNDVTVKAVVLQPYDVYVYDVFTMRSSTAVMKCHVPKVISTYVTVSSWIKDSETISNLGLAQGSKFNIIPSGELYIKDVTASDGRSTFDCKVTNKLTGEIKKSITSGKLYFITDPQRTVPPNITFSKKTVFAKEGEIALLPCEAQALPMPNIRWSRRSGIGAHEGLALKDRYSLVSGSLLIKNVYKSNSGAYICTASNVAGSETTDVQLVISERLMVSVDPANLIMEIGKPADLNCKTEGSPGTAIHWMKDAKPLTSLPGIQMHSNTSFRITLVSAEHEGIYQCFAKNNFEKAFAVAVLSLGDSPPVVVSGFKEHTLQPGSPGNLQCVFSGRPIPEVTWFIDGEAIPSNVVQKESINADNNISSAVTVVHLRNEDGGMYTCQASNRVGKAMHSARMNVYGKLQPRQRTKVIAVSRKTVVLHCPFFGYPFTTIQWEKDEHSLPSDFRERLTESESLIIQEVDRLSDSGIYNCRVKHANISIQSEVQLTVMVPPKWVIEPKNVTTKSGETVYLHCKADGLPEPIITWMLAKDRKRQISPIIPSPDKLVMKNGSVIFKRITKDKEGLYFCLASNGVGKSLSKSVVLHISAPLVFHENQKWTAGKRGQNLTLTCPALGDQLLTFVWSVKDSLINTRKNSRYTIKNTDVETEAMMQSNLTITWLDRKDAAIYTCRVENEYGKDEIKFNVTVQELPGAPVVDSAKEGTRSVSLFWRLSSNGNSPITKYIVQYKKESDSWQDRTMNMTVSGDASSAVVSGLQPATKYNFRVVAENAIGLGSFSNVVTGIWQKHVPTGAPLILEVESTDQHTLTITWEPPRKNQWNDGIRGYEIGFKVQGSPDDFTFRTLEVPEDYTEDLKYQLSDLKMFTLYSIVVQAYNTKGKGPSSEPVVCMTSEHVPSTPPKDIRCLALTSRSLYVFWVPPSQEYVIGIIQGFKVLYKPEAEWDDSAIRTKTSLSTRVMLQELEVNTKYEIQVLALTKVGDGIKSSPVYCKTYTEARSVCSDNGRMFLACALLGPCFTLLGLTCQTTTESVSCHIHLNKPSLVINQDASAQLAIWPQPPQAIKVLPSSSDSVMVVWKSPKNRIGGITKYNVYYKPMEQREEFLENADPALDGIDALDLMTEHVSQDANSHISPSDNQFLEVKGLKKYQKYAFWVTASSIKGEGPSTKIMVVTVADNTVPAKSASFDEIIKIHWKRDVVLPCKGVGVPPPQRKWMIGDKPLEVVGRNSLLSDGTLLINKVSSEDSGNYTCAIYNEHGKDHVSYSLVVQVPPAAPLLNVVSRSKTSIRLQWKSGPDGGEKVKGYILHFRQENGAWETKEISPDNYVYTLDGLAFGSTYQMYLEAFNIIGTGPPCDIITVATEGSVPPAAPLLDVVSRSKSSIRLQWKSGPDGGEKVKGYILHFRQESGAWKTIEISPNNCVYILDGLACGSTYQMYLEAFNIIGTGPPCDIITVATEGSVPPATPLLDVVSRSKSSIQLQWKSGPDGGEKVKGYILHFRQESGTWETKEISPDNYVYTLDGLACGSTYQMYLEAFNITGTGPPCDIITVTTEGSELLNPPEDSIIQEGSTYVTIPLDAWPLTGCPIENFHLEYKPLHNEEWTLVSYSLQLSQKLVCYGLHPSQEKLVLPGLNPATWYALRLVTETNGKNNVAEYRFSTLTSAGGTIPPTHIMLEHNPEPRYLFYLVPYISTVASFIVVIIASVIICVCVKGKNGSMGPPSDHKTYATAQLPDCIPQQPCSDMFLGNSAQSQGWSGTLNCRLIHPSQGTAGLSQGHKSDFIHQACNNSELLKMQEKTFMFPDSNAAQFEPQKGNPRPDKDDHQPPVGV